MKRPKSLLLLLVALSCAVPVASWGLDPPHDGSEMIDCTTCHITHHAVGGAITNVAGNPNLCMSCHTQGGRASSMSFADTDEAIPGSGGNSHRWDSGASGWVKRDPANTSPGTVQSGGSFSGDYAKSYVIRVTTAGDAGTARFDWRTTAAASHTFRDDFTAVAFNGSNGTESWSASPWQEVGEANGVAAGVVQVVANAACASGNCLRLGGGAINGIGVLRAADLSPGSSAMLTFTYSRRLATCPNTSTASVSLQASTNGATWVTLATYNLNACDTTSVAQAFDVTAQLAATAQIGFLGSGTAGATDFMYVDGVQLEYLAAGSGAASVATGTDVALDEGITVTFANGSSTPAFKLNDQWTVYVRPDVDQPTSPALAARLAGAKLMCSTCHNEHSQVADPFDPAAPPYPATGPGGEGRHNQRIGNLANEMCVDCHRGRNVTSSAAGSHPVGISIPAGAYKAPASLPLDHTNEIQCMSCHDVHRSASADGKLLRLTNVNSLCRDCHTVAATSPGTHLSSVSGVLWPGPQYGTLFPAISDQSQRGTCSNCHQPHGWPDRSAPGQHFPTLLVNREENLCNACHDGAPATNVLLQLTKSYRHPTTDYSGRHSAAEGGTAASYGTANRHAECEDCHDAHTAASDATAPVAPAASKRIRGVGRVSVVNGAAGTTPAYTYRGPADATAPIAEYQVCFKCHSSWTTQPAGQSDLALKFNGNNPSFHPVEAVGKNTNIRAASFVNGWVGTSTMYCTDCHTSDDPTVRGPHGSQYRYLLKRPSIASSSSRTMASTEACFDCHSFNVYANTQSTDTVLSNSRFNRPNSEEGHAFHIVEKRYPCYSCHDTHGSSTLPHMIVTGRNPGIKTYTQTATGGTCTPTCHGTESYSLNYPR